jgi:hypothetical protein
LSGRFHENIAADATIAAPTDGVRFYCPEGSVRIVVALAALAGLSGCASFATLDEAERARVQVVAPAAARFAPTVEFKIPPGKVDGAAAAAISGAGGAAAACLGVLAIAPAYALCLAAFLPPAMVAGAAFGAAATPSSEGIEAMMQRARGYLGAPDMQQLLVQRFSERVARATSHRIVPDALELGPQSPNERPSYSSAADGKGTLVAEVAVEWVGATLAERSDFFGPDYAVRPLRVGVDGRMRLVRPSDGATLMIKYYSVARYAGRIQEYEHDGGKLLLAVAGAVEEVATLMVDDAFLLRSDVASSTARVPMVAPLEPLPSGGCFFVASYDCWAFHRVPRLDTASPRFRWGPFPEPGHLEAAPWLRSARNLVYDLWIFGGDDDRIVEGLTSTEHRLERPLAQCRRYSWAVRARFDTDAGPRTVEWSTAAAFPRTQMQTGAERPTFGAPFITPCPANARDRSGHSKP